MYIERNGSRILAAYLDEQFAGQEWLPIERRALQMFLATAPSVGRGPSDARHSALLRTGLKLSDKPVGRAAPHARVGSC
jgi:hypothetical protein